MDSSDDSFLDESEDSQSDQESEESFESSSHQKQSKKILILSAESLSSAEGKKYVLPSEFDLGCLDSNKSPTNGKKGNPVVIKAQPISSSPGQYILLPESVSLSTAEEQNGLKMENMFYNCDEQNSEKRVRERNVTPSEKNTLLKIWQKYPVLNIKACNNEVNQRKRKAWQNIQKEFITVCPDPESNTRSIKFLQGCWKRFKKEMNKTRRETDEEEESSENVTFPSVCHKISTTLGKTESKHAFTTHSSNEGAMPSLNECRTSVSLVCQTPAKDPGVPSDPSPLLSDSDAALNESEKVISRGRTLSSNSHSGDSNTDLCNGGSSVSAKKTIASEQNDLNATSVFPLQKDPRVGLNSAFDSRPLSIRSLRRRALQLAVEVEKEKLAAFRCQREAEQERLAAIKLQRSAQKYALLVEKERESSCN